MPRKLIAMPGKEFASKITSGERNLSYVRLEPGFDLSGYEGFEHLQRYLKLYGPPDASREYNAFRSPFSGSYVNSNLSRHPIKIIGSDFTGLKARGLHLPYADGEGAKFEDADLSGAVLVNARLNGANLRVANLYQANFSGAKLPGADMSEANCQDTNFMSADLDRTMLRKAHMKGCNLRAATLRQADLWEACLQGADLQTAILWRAFLWETDLRGAKNFASSEGWKCAHFYKAKLDPADRELLKEIEMAAE